MYEIDKDYSEFLDVSNKRIIESDLTCTANQNLKLFEDSIKKTIIKFEKKHNKYRKKASILSDKISNIEREQSECDDVKELKYSELQNEKIRLYDKQHHYYIESYWIDQQLKSISEMQIISAFKNIEVNIKTLINIAYPKVNTKEFYKWESLIQFFKDKNIKVSDIQGYKEIIDLKNLNNSIKHNGVLNENIKKIEEFKTSEEFNFVNLINFYERIKDLIQTFLNLIAEEIRRDLFQFNEDRLMEISQDFKQRMGDSEIESLIEKLRSK